MLPPTTPPETPDLSSEYGLFRGFPFFGLAAALLCGLTILVYGFASREYLEIVTLGAVTIVAIFVSRMIPKNLAQPWLATRVASWGGLLAVLVIFSIGMVSGAF